MLEDKQQHTSTSCARTHTHNVGRDKHMQFNIHTICRQDSLSHTHTSIKLTEPIACHGVKGQVVEVRLQ